MSMRELFAGSSQVKIETKFLLLQRTVKFLHSALH